MDLKNLNMEELMEALNRYPWFAAARKELALRTGDFAEAVLYVSQRRVLFDAANGRETDREAVSESSIRPLLQPQERKVYVVGGDYFSQGQYDEVREMEDSSFSSFARLRDEESAPQAAEEGDFMDLCTETLAQIYSEQGYFDAAKEIYSKLSLRYPEKSVYFAALIDEINKNR